MKKNIPDFINELSDYKFEVLEELIEYKFFKVRRLYWLLNEHYEYITSLDCRQTEKDLLIVDVGCIDSEHKELIIDEITSNIEEDNIVLIDNDNGITIEITLEESTAI